MDDSKLISILKLVNGNKTEEKVAGVILADKYLLSVEDERTIVNVVYKVVKEVSTSFILKMIQSLDQNIVQQSGLALLVLSCKNKKTILLFKKHISSFVSIIFTPSIDSSIRSQVVIVLKSLVTLVSSTHIAEALQSLLTVYVLHPLTMNPIDVLELFVEILQLYPSKSLAIALSSMEAGTLRSLFVQVFHGAAPEGVRDRALCLLRDILTIKTTASNVHALSALWTTAVSAKTPIPVLVKESEEEGDRKKGPSSNADESFPILLCSIVRGELHLLGEELLSLSSLNTAASEPSAAIAEGESAATSRVSDLTVLTRIARCTSMHSTCMSLLDCFLELLVGGALSDLNTAEGNEEQETDSPSAAPWSELPYQVSLDVKKSLDGSLSELLEFAKECGKILNAVPQGSRAVPLMSPMHLRNLASRSVMTVCGYVAEDEGMHALLITYLGDVLQCSVVGLLQASSAVVDHDVIWNAIVSVGLPDATQSTRGDNSTLPVEELEETDSVSPAAVTVLVGDVLQYLLPCLLTILTTLHEEDSEATAAEKKEQRVQLDRFYNALDGLMPRVTQLVCVLLAKITQILKSENNSKTTTSSSSGVTVQRTALNRGAGMCVLALDLLLKVLSAKDRGLRVLLRSEGEAAFQQVVSLQASQVRGMYSAMKECRKSTDRFMKRLETEFELSMQNLGTPADSVGGESESGGVEGDALDLLCSMEQLQEVTQTATKLLDDYSKISSVVTC